MPSFRAPAFFALPLAALLAGCSDIGSTVNSTLGLGGGSNSVSAQSNGLAVGDEPFAVKTGTAILTQGGSAADAVTAMFFAMTATYPVAAGLGGGGICIVADPVKGVQEFDFLPRAARAGGAYAVPGAVRGFYDLQKAFGSLPWQREVVGRRGLCGSGLSHQSRIVGAPRQCAECYPPGCIAGGRVFERERQSQARRHGGRPMMRLRRAWLRSVFPARTDFIPARWRTR